MKALFMGLGSIGKRHWRLLGDIRPDIERIHFDRTQSWRYMPKADMAFICMPTQYHVEAAIACIESGIKNLFIEKPLSVRNPLDNLLKSVRIENVATYMAYPFRHHSAIKRLKEDPPKSLSLYCYSNSQKWPSKRPIDNVLFELSHELDIVYWLTGQTRIHGAFDDTRAMLNMAGYSVSLDIRAPFEARYVGDEPLTIDDSVYADQLTYFLANLGNLYMMNNVYEHAVLLQEIIKCVEAPSCLTC